MKSVTLKNSLSIKNPDAASEWDYRKNHPLTPRDVSYGSQQKAWFRCARNHEWQASILSRSNGSGCPYCSKTYKRVCVDNCLATINPKLASEWHPTKNGNLTPHNVTAHSGKKVYWICKRGHVWRTSVSQRSDASRKRGCPYCSGKKACIDNCLAKINPELAKEWHLTKNNELTSYDVTYGSKKKVWWICEKGHEYQSTICNRQSGRGCPYCSGKKVNKDNCLATVNPELSKEWNYIKNGNLSPFNITSNSGKSIWWKCLVCSHEWKSSVSNRNNLGNGCPFCQGVTLKDGIHCDSIVEAYLYLKYKKAKKIFLHHGRYGKGMGRRKYDFYFPLENKYVEVTGYHRHSHHYLSYLRNVVIKRRHVREILHANFEFVQLKSNKVITKYVNDNSLKT